MCCDWESNLNLWVCRMVLQPLSHLARAHIYIFKNHVRTCETRKGLNRALVSHLQSPSFLQPFRFLNQSTCTYHSWPSFQHSPGYHTLVPAFFFLSFFKILFIYLREGEGGRKRERRQCVVASHVPLVGDLACNPGMCPDLESNQ